MSSNLTFNNFSRGPLEERVQAFKTVLRIFCRSFSIYLATEGLERLTAKKSTGTLS